MKLTTLLLFAAFMQISAAGLAQRLTLVKKNVTLKEVFKEINKQTNYNVFCSSDEINTVKVEANFKDTPLLEVLNKCLENTNLTYAIEDKSVIIKEKALTFIEKIKDFIALPHTIHGTVTDENGQPLPGATITVEDIKTSTITDDKGQFRISINNNDAILTISFIGFKNKNVLVSSSSDNLIITLEHSASKLDEIQVIGYGETTKRLNTGSVSSITAADIEDQPVSNPLEAIQGRAPGVLVQTQNGLPGGNIKIQVRGQGSLASGTDPFFIIDGVPFLSAPLYGNGSANGANGTISPFSILNPDDIESIEILKDADATAIYGSRAANGVVLITTKKGKAGKEKVTFDISHGISKVGRLTQYLGLSDYLLLRHQAFSNDNVVPTVSSAPDLLSWDTTKYTNWQKYFYGGAAQTTTIQGSLSGGDVNNQFLLSANYHTEGTILPGDENYTKGGGYFNFNHLSNHKKFNYVFSVNYSKDDNNTLYSSTDNSLGVLPPDFPVYNADGSFNWDLGYNPVAALQQKQESKTAYLNVNTMIRYTLLQGLDAKVSIGYNNYTISQVATLPLTSQYPGYSPIPTAYFANNSSERYLIEPQLNYHRDVLLGTLTALVGGTYQSVLNQGMFLEGDNVNNPNLLGNIGAASTIVGQTNSYSQYKYVSVFSRLNYVWNKKYILDINFRRDGSSRFGPDRQFGNFWAVGGAWIFSDEDFIKKNLSLLSFGKLRSSYGTTGNDQISDYQYLSSYSSSTSYGGITTLSPARVANPNYSWETTKKFEVALELGFLHDRISLTSAWYDHTSGNQLISYKIPYIAGFASYQANFPATIRNTGFEFGLNIEAFKGKGFNWRTSFNLTLPQNKLVAFPNLASSSYANTYVVGQDLSAYKSYQLVGVDPQTGLAILRDVNLDGKISSPADYVVTGKTSPTLFGGWGNTLSYKGIQLDFLFEAVKRSYPSYKPLLGSLPENDPEFVVNRWQKPGDITDIPRATVNGNLAQYTRPVWVTPLTSD